MVPDVEELHEKACLAGSDTYVDPGTGYEVFTADYLRRRRCCGCGCRHCPYRASDATAPTAPAHMLHGNLDDLADDIDILFWSGGKDSFLAFRALQREAARKILFVTTYAQATRVVAHQDVPITLIERQAIAMGTPALAVPLSGGDAGYVQHLQRAMQRITAQGVSIHRVTFGDLHLNHIREWRDANLGSLGAELYYPLWNRSYEDLMVELEGTGYVVRVCAVAEVNICAGAVEVGDLYNRQFWKTLPKNADLFGENGEFHTVVELWNQPDGSTNHSSISSA